MVYILFFLRAVPGIIDLVLLKLVLLRTEHPGHLEALTLWLFQASKIADRSCAVSILIVETRVYIAPEYHLSQSVYDSRGQGIDDALRS